MAKYQLLLPKMGESVAEATVIKWLKNPGDYVQADEAVLEIATDKVDSEVPSPVAGRLAEQLCKVDDVVQVGAVVAILETADAAQPAAAPTPAPAPTPVQQPVVSAPAPQPVAAPVQQPVIQTPPSAAPQPAPVVAETKAPEPAYTPQAIPGTEMLRDIPKPQPVVGESIRFYSPLVRSIAAQEGIGANELDKITGTGADGRLTKDDLLSYIRNKQNGNGAQAIAQAPVTTFPESPAPVAAQATDNLVVDPAAPAVEPVFTPPTPKPEPQPEQKAAQPASAPAPKSSSNGSVSGGDEIIEMDRMRKLIAEHMVYSKHTSPHVTSFVEADVTNLVQWREKVKNSFEKREGEKITFTPIFIEAVVKAIKDYPMVNVTVSGTQITKKRDINISLATALPNGNLIVPVIKRADELNLVGLTKSVNDLAKRARGGKLLPDDVKDGTFTLTNVGSFGNVMGTPIINQPQVAILAVGTIKKKPAVIETKEGDAIAIRHMMFLSLSYDHRVVDGALGGSFLRRVADYLENWDSERHV
jgi:2-oxoglutarate dehydrogenase E2 component (dihydrolipoamide succinyltransferase)